jgi:hypothetical protein
LHEDLAKRLGRPLHATLLFDYPTIEALLDYLCELTAHPTVPPATAVPEPVTRPDIDELSEEAAELLLRRELERLQ